MSVEFIEGFDHYTTGYNRKWDTSGGVTVLTGRFGGNGAAPDAGGFRKMLTNNFSTVVMGFAFTRTTLAAFGIASFQDGGTVSALGTNQVELRITATGALQITRNGTVVATSATGVLTGGSGVWQYIEWKVTIGTSGTYEVRVGGVNVLSGTGNIQNTANAFVNQMCLNIVGGDNGRGNGYDDFYCLNGLGTTNNDFLGDSRVMTSLPSGDGATTQWTPSTGTTHFSLIDESTPNDDTDYISSATSGQIDLHTFPAATITGSIVAVQYNACARKDDIGLRQIQEQCRSGSTTYTGSTTHTLTSNYLYYRQIREVDPATGVAWTGTGVNAAQFGVKVV